MWQLRWMVDKKTESLCFSIKSLLQQTLLPIWKKEINIIFNDVYALFTFIVSPSEKGFENCIDNPLSTFPRTSLEAKAVATPITKYITLKKSQILKQMQ